MILNELKHEDVAISVLTSAKKAARIEGVRFIHCPSLSAQTKYHSWIKHICLGKTRWFQNIIEQHDVIYIPDHSYPLIIPAKMKHKKVIVHLHDFQPLVPCGVIFSDNRTKGYKRYFKLFKNNLIYERIQGRGLLRVVTTSYAQTVNTLVSLALTQADVVICVTESQAQTVVNHLPWLKKNLCVVHNLLPEDIPFCGKPTSQTPTFLYSGGSNAIKGVDTFIRASVKMLQRGKDSKFILTGVQANDNWMRWFRSTFSWEKILAKLNNAFVDSYRTLEWANRSKLIELYKRSWASVFPTAVEEYQPYTVLESMLSGRIPVISRVEGLLEIASGTLVEKFAFTPGSCDELTDRMMSLSSLSRENLEEIGRRLRASVLRKCDRRMIMKKLTPFFLN